MLKIKRRYYLLKDEKNYAVTVISVDSTKKNPWKDEMFRPLLEAKLNQAITGYSSTKLKSFSLEDSETSSDDYYLLTVLFEDEDDNFYSTEIWSLEIIDIL